MVIESLGAPSSGALTFLLSCLEDSLLQERKPWAIIEANDGKLLYAPALSRTLREKMSEGRLLWIRVPEKDIPEVLLKVLQSALFSGVFLRAFEGVQLGERLRVWMRRWQLAAEKTGTHWLWQHSRATARLGVSLSISWLNKKSFEIHRGHSFLEDCVWPTVRKLSSATKDTAVLSKADQQQEPASERKLCLIAN